MKQRKGVKQIDKKDQLHIIKTMNMMCKYLTEHVTDPAIKTSARNYEVATIIQSLNKLKTL